MTLRVRTAWREWSSMRSRWWSSSRPAVLKSCPVYRSIAASRFRVSFLILRTSASTSSCPLINYSIEYYATNTTTNYQLLTAPLCSVAPIVPVATRYLFMMLSMLRFAIVSYTRIHVHNGREIYLTLKRRSWDTRRVFRWRRRWWVRSGHRTAQPARESSSEDPLSVWRMSLVSSSCSLSEISLSSLVPYLPFYIKPQKP